MLLMPNIGIGQKKQLPLQIGDRLPELLITNIINQQEKQAFQIRDLYTNGLLIIDFWATWCVPCIHEMEFLDSLRGAYPEKFKVLMVTYEDKTRIDNFLSGTAGKKIGTKNLIIATCDTLLHQLFPHRTIPHNVWVDSNGIIRAITTKSEITADNILSFRSGETSSLRHKKESLNFNPINEFHFADSTFSYRSIISPHISVGTSGTRGGSIAEDPRSFFQWNGSITHLFFNAYSLYNEHSHNNRYPSFVLRDKLMEVHTRDSLRLFYPSEILKKLLNGSKYKDLESWGEENTYCYALTLPKRVKHTKFRDYMFSDLERQFNIRASIESRKTQGMVVTLDRERKFTPLSGKSDTKPSIIWISTQKLKIENSSIDAILNWMYASYDDRYIKLPFFNEVAPERDIRINTTLNFADLINEKQLSVSPEMIWKKLGEYGFRFREGIRNYPILILKDLN